MKRACLYQTQKVMNKFLCEFYPVGAVYEKNYCIIRN
jgi:hypothetical protein